MGLTMRTAEQAEARHDTAELEIVIPLLARAIREVADQMLPQTADRDQLRQRETNGRVAIDTERDTCDVL
jgi:hypothetical protein